MSKTTERKKYINYITIDNFSMYFNKAELLQEGIFFPPPFICQRRFSNEKVGNQKN